MVCDCEFTHQRHKEIFAALCRQPALAGAAKMPGPDERAVLRKIIASASRLVSPSPGPKTSITLQHLLQAYQTTLPKFGIRPGDDAHYYRVLLQWSLMAEQQQRMEEWHALLDRQYPPPALTSRRGGRQQQRKVAQRPAIRHAAAPAAPAMPAAAAPVATQVARRAHAHTHGALDALHRAMRKRPTTSSHRKSAAAPARTARAKPAGDVLSPWETSDRRLVDDLLSASEWPSDPTPPPTPQLGGARSVRYDNDAPSPTPGQMVSPSRPPRIGILSFAAPLGSTLHAKRRQAIAADLTRQAVEASLLAASHRRRALLNSVWHPWCLFSIAARAHRLSTFTSCIAIWRQYADLRRISAQREQRARVGRFLQLWARWREASLPSPLLARMRAPPPRSPLTIPEDSSRLPSTNARVVSSPLRLRPSPAADRLATMASGMGAEEQRACSAPLAHWRRIARACRRWTLLLGHKLHAMLLHEWRQRAARLTALDARSRIHAAARRRRLFSMAVHAHWLPANRHFLQLRERSARARARADAHARGQAMGQAWRRVWDSALQSSSLMQRTVSATAAVDARRIATSLRNWHTVAEELLDFSLLLAQGDACSRRRRLIPSIARWNEGVAHQRARARAEAATQLIRQRRGLAAARLYSECQSARRVTVGRLVAAAQSARLRCEWLRLCSGCHDLAEALQTQMGLAVTSMHGFRSRRLAPAWCSWRLRMKQSGEHCVRLELAMDHRARGILGGWRQWAADGGRARRAFLVVSEAAPQMARRRAVQWWAVHARLERDIGELKFALAARTLRWQRALRCFVRHGVARHGCTQLSERASLHAFARSLAHLLGRWMDTWRSMAWGRQLTWRGEAAHAASTTGRAILLWRMATVRRRRAAAMMRVAELTSIPSNSRAALLRLRVHAERCRMAADSASARLARLRLTRMLARWLSLARQHARLIVAKGMGTRLVASRLRASCWSAWRRAFAVRELCHQFVWTRERECRAKHLHALHRLCVNLRRARAQHKVCLMRIGREHLLALSRYCAKRSQLRRDEQALVERRCAAERAFLFGGWRMQLAAISAANGLRRAWLEGMAVLCWQALRAHVHRSRQAAQWRARCEALIHDAITSRPGGVGATAFRCLARWRLLLIGRLLTTWRLAACGRVRRRRLSSASNALHRRRLLFSCMDGWREATWHEQLMRRVRLELAEERKRMGSGADDPGTSGLLQPWVAIALGHSHGVGGIGGVTEGPVLRTPDLDRRRAATSAAHDVDGTGKGRLDVGNLNRSFDQAALPSAEVGTAVASRGRHEDMSTDSARGAGRRAEELAALEARIAHVKARVLAMDSERERAGGFADDLCDEHEADETSMVMMEASDAASAEVASAEVGD
jgi:hypothetical protein